MKQRINLLIAFSVVALIVLSTVQCYLVKTAYDYKVAQFHTQIKNEIAQITNNYSYIDSALVSKKEALYKNLSQNYIKGKDSESKNILIGLSECEEVGLGNSKTRKGKNSTKKP